MENKLDEEKIKRVLPRDEEENELFDATFPVVSSMECTGLIPAAPGSTEEVESYDNIYDIPLSKDKKAAENHLQDVKKSKSPRL